MSAVVVSVTTYRIVVDPQSSKVTVLRGGPAGSVGPQGPFGVPGAESNYVSSAIYSAGVDELDARIDAYEYNTAWELLTLVNGWLPLGGWQAPRVRRFMDVVYLDGLIQHPAAYINGVMFVLPELYRPKKNRFISVAAGANLVGRLLIRPNGNVTYQSGNAGFMQLFGIRYSLL